VATGLLAGNAAGAQTAVFIFFPLIFLAPTFLPREQLQGWLEVVARPTRRPTSWRRCARCSSTGGTPARWRRGFGVVGALCVLSLVWATRVAGRITARR
jgi:hypothetical protein